MINAIVSINPNITPIIPKITLKLSFIPIPIKTNNPKIIIPIVIFHIKSAIIPPMKPQIRSGIPQVIKAMSLMLSCRPSSRIVFIIIHDMIKLTADIASNRAATFSCRSFPIRLELNIISVGIHGTNVGKNSTVQYATISFPFFPAF
ncbi:hypothetical protein [Bartonella sp. OC16QHHD]|uniref:hypothetical protein n=1 Tax=Bartonella sp. OC16QHHD TaxID=3243562 RepID=UPI0035D10840